MEGYSLSPQPAPPVVPLTTMGRRRPPNQQEQARRIAKMRYFNSERAADPEWQATLRRIRNARRGTHE